MNQTHYTKNSIKLVILSNITITPKVNFTPKCGNLYLSTIAFAQTINSFSSTPLIDIFFDCLLHLSIEKC